MGGKNLYFRPTRNRCNTFSSACADEHKLDADENELGVEVFAPRMKYGSNLCSQALLPLILLPRYRVEPSQTAKASCHPQHPFRPGHSKEVVAEEIADGAYRTHYRIGHSGLFQQRNHHLGGDCIMGRGETGVRSNIL